MGIGNLIDWLRGKSKIKPLPEDLWQSTLAGLPFLTRLTAEERARLRMLAEAFLAAKEFTTAGGLRLSDAMCASIAAASGGGSSFVASGAGVQAASHMAARQNTARREKGMGAAPSRFGNEIQFYRRPPRCPRLTLREGVKRPASSSPSGAFRLVPLALSAS